MIDHKVFMTALNFKTFLGMVRVDGPPEWASGEGRYVLEADYKALEEALRQYGRHSPLCESMNSGCDPSVRKCFCGYAALESKVTP